jgi:hypothetical protein
VCFGVLVWLCVVVVCVCVCVGVGGVCVCVCVCVCGVWHEMKVWERLANYTCDLHIEQMCPQRCFQISSCYDPIQSLQK